MLIFRPVKSPLKVQNGVQEVDSPIKKVAKRSRQILESDEEDEASVVKEQVVSKGQGDKEAPSKTEKVKGSNVSRLFIFIYCSVMFLQKLIEGLVGSYCNKKQRRPTSHVAIPDVIIVKTTQ